MDEVRSKYGSNHQKNYKTGMAGKIALLVIVFVVIGIVITGMAAYLGVSKVLTTALAEEKLAQALHSLGLTVGLVALATVVISVPVAIIWGRILMKPVIRLNEAFAHMADGEIEFDDQLFSDLKMRPKDEIGQMMTSFTTMKESRRQLVEAAEALAKGDLTVEIKPSSQQDRMADALIDMVDQLNLLYKEIEKAGYEVAYFGHFDYKGDPEVLAGSYQDFVSGINQVMEGLIQPLRNASRCINQIGAGVIPEKITETYNGDFNILKDSINACIDGLGALTAGNEVLDHIDRNDFSRKIAGNYSGLYGSIAGSINRAVDQFNRIIVIVDNIAQGEFTYLDELKEMGKLSDADTLTPSLIEMIETIQRLVEETRKMTQSAVAGNLSNRGDPDRFKGGYAKVINGFNQTLDAVIAPINEASEVMTALSKGNLQVEMTGDYAGDHAEIKTALNKTTYFLKQVVGEITMVLINMQKGELNQEITAYYHGDFFEIKKAINDITTQLSSTLSEINAAAEQVENGARQISSGGQGLSQGSTEQASAIEELTASIEEVAEKTKKNAISANQASELTLSVQENAQLGNGQMKKMMAAMDEINNSSKNISRIIKVIDDIAFQTNILALNAAVEAARAGQHGKGFAVVAEEVRTLAARSAEAAKETTGLIEGSINKVVMGNTIADETAISLQTILEKIEEVTGIVSKIAEGSNEQASAIAEITLGIEQVSVVVQTNSATAEQSAAASEELSGQAEMLKQMIGVFKLKDLQKIGKESGKIEVSAHYNLEQRQSVPEIILDEAGTDKY
ncbi:MAG: methyl-accepting chemotaxis protein [Acetobacterium sp.]|nr:methyl-accepting chemotaxis protein [Acetobacterium sp.]